MIEFTLNDQPVNFLLNRITESDTPDNIRLLEDGEPRELEDDTFRLLES